MKRTNKRDTALFDTTMAKVRSVLKDYPETRDSDKLLWLYFNIKYNGLDLIIDGSSQSNISFKQWLLISDVPTFETLTRCRRKLQELHSELVGDKKRRSEAETQYRRYFRS